MAERPKCRAMSKTTGERCGKYAVPGLEVCRWHGGSTAAAKAKSERAVRRMDAEIAAQRLGVPVAIGPQQALLDEVQRAAGMIAYYGARVEEIAEANRADLVFGLTRKESRDGFQAGDLTVKEAGANIWLTLWNEERDRLTKVAAAAIKAGIEERRIELAEQQGMLIATVIRRILDRLNLSEQQRILVGEVVPEELRALAAG